MNRIAAVFATSIASLGLASASLASPITLQYTGFVSPPAPTGTITNNGAGQSAAAGQFNFNVLTDNDGVYWDSTLQAFCIDIGSNLVTNSPATYSFNSAAGSARLNNQQLALIGQLYDNHAAALGNNINDAAFQLALWEIVYEAPNTLSLSNGDFSSTAFGPNGGARTVANDWLAGLDLNSLALSSQWEFFVLEAISPIPNQALLVAREIAVSEPATLVLLIGGLGLGLMFHRRRQPQS